MQPETEVVENSWATRRRTIVLLATILILSGISFAIFWFFWYKPPTCFDKIKNGDETGIDCGGACSQICGSDVTAPIVRWDPRLFEVSLGIWSMLVYVENPNVSLDASYAPYSFTIFGDNNETLWTKKGATILPKNKTVGIFEGGIKIAEGKQPKRALFELGDNISWTKNENAKDDLMITHSPLLNSDIAPRVEANVKNNGLTEFKNIELIVAVFDESDNAIAASRSFIEDLKKGENTNVVFTWPNPFSADAKTIEITYKIFGDSI
jgi:hypothetical protein